ncbi:MAG: hypothetical protein LBL99_02025 [Holosporaceae bacterium]|jgi:hypothetical protein|nr:hypothetical protein [Holosporaceae bacterium]
MAILTQSGRTAIARSVKSQTIHLAWGTGQSEGGANVLEPEDPTQTALIHEIGRRVADEVLFCVGDDEEGDLLTPTGRFRAVEQPTNNLFIRTTYDFTDGSEYTIREFGLFVGTKTALELPEGQKYFLPTDIVDPGILLLLEHSVPLIRTPATRESFSFVVSF